MRVDQEYMKRIHSKLKSTIEYMEKDFKERFEQVKKERDEAEDK